MLVWRAPYFLPILSLPAGRDCFFSSEDDMRSWLPALLASGILLAAYPSPAARADGQVQFQRDIRPILANHCFKCHGPAMQEAGLRLDQRDRATRRQVIVPGKPALSK